MRIKKTLEWKKMILNDISIINFKNIADAKLSLSAKLNCFVGHNGEGKTNFLDAVYYLSFCHSAFNPIDSQVITHEKDFFMIDGLYSNETDGCQENVYCGVKRGVKKHFKRNGKEYKRLAEHIGKIPLVFISPADSAIIDGAGDERRKFMDMVISQYDSAYLDNLTSYNKVLSQRNALLKSEDEPEEALMDILEEQMADYGEKIFKKRSEFIEQFKPMFQKNYSDISSEKEQVDLRYISHCQRGRLIDVIRRDRMKDRIMGHSLHGTHRDDVEMLINGYNIRKEGSQGQCKTFVLSLKLSQFNFLRQTASHTTPLLLLDDIFDKLDATRVEQIIKLVSGADFGQIFITDTNREHLDAIVKKNGIAYKLFTVKGGVITETEKNDV